MDKMLKKIIALLLVITLAGANLSILGMYGITYALSEDELASQKTVAGNSNVEFNSYFEGGKHSQTQDTEKPTELFVNVKVKNVGYLKDAQIQFENANFKIGQIESQYVQSVDAQNGKIVLKQLNNGSDVTLEIPITMLNQEVIPQDNFAKETKTVFSGIYVDENGKENQVSNEIINKLSWNADAKASLEAKLVKYIPYKIDDDTCGLMLQAKLDISIVDGKLPIKNTQIKIQVPQIKEQKPESVKVVVELADGTTKSLNIEEQNCVYDTETGIVTITVSNEKDEIMWLKNVADKYFVTFIYSGQEIYDEITKNGIDTQMLASAEVEVYNSEETILTIPSTSLEMEQKQNLGEIVDFEMEATTSLSKGQIYANYDSSVKNETDYFETYIATIYNKDITEELEFSQAESKFLSKEDSMLNNSTYNKQIKVDVEEFNSIFGQEGKIEIYNTEGTKIGVIEAQTEIEDGKYVLDISYQAESGLVIKTTKPVSEGKIKIEVQKAITEITDYSKEEVKTFNKMQVGVTGKAGTSSIDMVKQIKFVEPKSVAKITVSKKDLTTVVKNEKVEIRATLDTSNLENALYKNPTLKIELPSQIENVQIVDKDIIMANGLKIKGNPKVTTENGKKIITVQLEGTQKEYTVNADYEGTIVVLIADLTVKQLSPSAQSKITMQITNQNDAIKEQNIKVETPLNIVGPTGIIAANGLANYADGKNDILSISSKSVTAQLDTYAKEKVATVSGKVINNYQNPIDDVVILGRFPTKDNVNMDSNESLGSTFTIGVNSDIKVDGLDSKDYEVYYSNEIDAEVEEDVWNKTRTQDSKSYKIELNENEVKQGEVIDFSYNIKIPQNLEHNQSAYEMYKVYYKNISEIGQLQETKTSPIVGESTGEGTELDVELANSVDTVREGQIVRLDVKVTNTGAVDAENVTVTAPLPDKSSFVNYIKGSGFEEVQFEEGVVQKQLQLEVGTIKVGETKVVSYYIKIDGNTAIPFDEKTITTTEQKDEWERQNAFPKEVKTQVSVTAEGEESKVTSNELSLSIQKGGITTAIYTDVDENFMLQEGNSLFVSMNITNNSSQKELQDVKVKLPLPEGFTCYDGVIKDKLIEGNETSKGITYNKETNTVEISIGTLERIKYVKLELIIGKCEGPVELKATTTTSTEGFEGDLYSNIINLQTGIPKLEVSKLTSSPKYVKEGELITYSLTITNSGDTTISNIQVSDELPADVTFQKATYVYSGVEHSLTDTSNGQVAVSINHLNAGESIQVNIIAKAGVLVNVNEKEIENAVSVSALNIEKITTNTVTNTIEYSEQLHERLEEQSQNGVGGGSGGSSFASGYKVTGTAWLDANHNGMRDDEEQPLSGITVALLNKSDNSIVKDASTNQEKRTTTDSNGTYQFENIPNGDYYVMFQYDASKYDITTYQATGVDESLNSDAISINATINGVRQIVGTSDIIQVKGSNVRDIDIGLYESEKFDLKLDKYISKITVTTPKKTKTYGYKNSKIAKPEIANSDLGKSTVAIEYKIVITNEGAVPGYARKIVDYLPEGVSFNSELNQDWYLSENGNVYNSSLANTLLQPGESKELTLVVTKKYSKVEVLNNLAEIYESYNEQGLADMDSEPANQAKDEDDLSQADVILSLNTGTIIRYTTYTLGILTIIACAIVIIKKKVLDDNEI